MIDGVSQHHRNLRHRPSATLFMPLVEGILHRRQVPLAGGDFVDDLLGIERRHYVINWA